MMRSHRGQSLRRRINLFLHRWHRRAGISASVFLIWMAVSGWLLNHTAALELSHRFIFADSIVAHYGIRNELPSQAEIAGHHWLASGADIVVLDGRKIAIALQQPQGMVLHDGLLFIADANTLFVFSEEGSLVDKIATPAPIVRMGAGCNGVVLATEQKQWVTHDGATFTECEGEVAWARSQPLNAEQRAALQPLLKSGVSFERLLLDLHSGRFFGAWGPWFVDVVGLGLVALALSGLLLFFRHRRPRESQR